MLILLPPDVFMSRNNLDLVTSGITELSQSPDGFRSGLLVQMNAYHISMRAFEGPNLLLSGKQTPVVESIAT
jgi:hypothetical protein